MQGRIYPERPDKLQVFPSNKWKLEFFEAKKLGFDYIELLYDVGEDESNPLRNNQGLERISETVESAQLTLHSICADYFTKFNLLDSSDHRPWAELTKLIDCAEKLSVPEIIIPFFDKNTLNKTTDLKHFLRLAAGEIMRASDKGICLCIETTLAANDLLAAFNAIRTAAKICYDLGNAAAMGHQIVGEIELLGYRIGLVHIKDRKKNGGPNVLMGEGSVDFAAAFKALKKAGYKGNFTLETAPGANPIANAKTHLAKVKEMAGGLV